MRNVSRHVVVTHTDDPHHQTPMLHAPVGINKNDHAQLDENQTHRKKSVSDACSDDDNDTDGSRETAILAPRPGMDSSDDEFDGISDDDTSVRPASKRRRVE